MKTVAIISALLMLSLVSGNAMAGTWKASSYDGIYGKRNYKVYIPNTLKKNSKFPVVIMLHGCQQNAEDFAKGTRIEKWADKNKFIALFPEQNSAFNSFRCWNWIIPGNNSRMGESQVIIQMLDTVLKEHNGDNERVFAVGMSAGGSMVSILGNCYPERFKALASHDGSQFYSSYFGLDFTEIVLNGASVPALVSASYGNSCSSSVTNRPNKMPIIIFHGMKSPLMSPTHAVQVESEFIAFNDYLDNGVKDNSFFLEKGVLNIPASDVYGYNLFTTTNTDHEVLIERYMIDDLTHGWSGGVKDMPYNDPKGPDASALIFKFFRKNGL